MHEAYSTYSGEDETALSGPALAAEQIRDIVASPKLGLHIEESETAEMWSKRLSDWAMDAKLEGALDIAGYSEEECTDGSNKLLRLGLMTPHFVYASEHKKAHTNDTAEIRDLIKYNEVLRTALKANSELSPQEFAAYLQSITMWADVPTAHRLSTEKIINTTINGARGELIFGQIVDSESMRNKGIFYRDASTEDDIRGIDCRVSILFGQDRVILPVNVKTSTRQIASLANSKESKPYAIAGNAAVMWAGVNLADLKDNLLLDQDAAEKKVEPMAKLLRMAGADYYDKVRKGLISRDLGQFATRVA